MPKIGIVLGSRSDEPYIDEALKILEDAGVDYEVRVLSAHRDPEGVREYGLKAHERGVEVIIACVGLSAHLPGVLSSWTKLPVIGVPLPAGELQGLDALLSISQMPGGVPVATMGIGKKGVKNAALFALRILSLKYPEIKGRLE